MLKYSSPLSLQKEYGMEDRIVQVSLHEDAAHLLDAIARYSGVTPEALAKSFVVAGIRRFLDPETLLERIENEKEPLIQNSEEWRRDSPDNPAL